MGANPEQGPPEHERGGQELDEGEGLQDCGHGGQVSKRNTGRRVVLEFQIKKIIFIVCPKH